MIYSAQNVSYCRMLSNRFEDWVLVDHTVYIQEYIQVLRIARVIDTMSS